jgi:hypothetical protein
MAMAEVMTDVMARLVTHWTRQELAELSRHGTVMCLKTGENSYRIGNYDLRKGTGGNWTVEHVDGAWIHDFCSKHAAVFYCIFDSKQRSSIARDLLNNDRHLALLKSTTDNYYEQLKRAVDRRDEWRQDLFAARLSSVFPQLETARANLEKTIAGAKYSKVWENKT